MKALLCALACVLPIATHAAEVEVTTATGPASVTVAPDKVVVLDLAAIDTLTALGVTIAGKPDIVPPAYLVDALADVPTVGTLFEPDFEALAAMAPDLVVAGGRSAGQVAALSAIAPTLDMTIAGDDLVADTGARLAAYGVIFDKADQAATLQAELDGKIAAARAAVKDKGNGLVLLTNGGKMAVYGHGSRFGWIHAALELPEADPGMKVADSHGEAISFEYVAEINPEWLLVIDRGAAVGQGGQAAAATLDNPLIAGTNAAKKGQIIYLDPASMYLAGGGLQSLSGTLDQLTAAFGAAGN